MTILRKTTKQDEIRELFTYLKKYKVRTKKEYGCTIVYIYEPRFFGKCLAYLNIDRNRSLCRNEELALQLNAKYPDMVISLVSPENRIA